MSDSWRSNNFDAVDLSNIKLKEPQTERDSETRSVRKEKEIHRKRWIGREKYLKLKDLVQIILLNVEYGESKIEHIVKVLITMMDVKEVEDAHYEKTVSVLFDHDQCEVVFITLDYLSKTA